MVDIDLNDIQILTSQDIDLAQVSHFKKVESQNNYLKYGLVFSFILFGGLIYYNHSLSRSKKNQLKSA